MNGYSAQGDYVDRVPVVVILSPDDRIEVSGVSWSLAGAMRRLGGWPIGWSCWLFRVEDMNGTAQLLVELNELGVAIDGGGMSSPDGDIEGMREGGWLDDRPFLLATNGGSLATWYVQPF